MRNSFLFLLALFVPISGFTQTKVLFLGNSYTGVNSLPTLVYEVALSKGDTLMVDWNTPGGYTFEGHSTNATSLAKINAEDWDFVVLQEQSQRPSFTPTYVQANVFPYAEALVDSIKANNPCTEPVFYMTWGRKYGDQQNCPVWPWSCTFDSMQYKLRENYLLMTHANDATVAPAGISWQTSWHGNQNIDLWTSDNSHPSIHGSYLTACTFYATMFQESPVGSWYPNTITAAEAQYLQNVAATTVLDSLDQWRIGHQFPEAGFSWNANALNVTFTDTSSNATDWYWDFGDGFFGNGQAPDHVYGMDGTYEVTLIASNDCFSDTMTTTISISATGLQEHHTPQLHLYPNPVADVLNLELDQLSEHGTIFITDISGRLIRQLSTSSRRQRSQLLQIDCSNLKSGTYLIHLSTSKMIVTEIFTKD